MAFVQSKREAIHAAAAAHRAHSVAVFGSVARGGDTPARDIDFLVQFEPCTVSAGGLAGAGAVEDRAGQVAPWSVGAALLWLFGLDRWAVLRLGVST